MARQKHYVIYVPGIKDDLLYVQSLLIQTWRFHSVQPVMLTMPWAGDGEFEPKLARLIAKIDTYRQSGRKVSLVGASAGASAVLNAYMQRKDDINAVAYICGKINFPDTVAPRIYAKNPAFKTSLQQLQQTLRRLTPSDRTKLHSFYSPIDTTVPYPHTVIDNATEKKLPSLRHMWAILYALSLGSSALIQAIKK